MRRISIAGATALTSLLLASTAFASTTAYSGSFAGTGKLSFKISEKRHVWRLFSLAFEKFPLDCAGGHNTETAALKPSYRPVQADYPKLRVDAVFTLRHHRKPLSTLVLKGTVDDSGKSASGTMRIHGRKVPSRPPERQLRPLRQRQGPLDRDERLAGAGSRRSCRGRSCRGPASRSCRPSS